MSDKTVMAPLGSQTARYSFADNPKEHVSLAIYGVAGLILVTVGRIQEFIPVILGLPLAKMFFILLGIALLSSPSWSQDRFRSYPQVKLFFLLFVLGWISAPFSLWPSRSMDFMKVTFLSLALFIFFLIRFCDSWQAIKTIVWTLIASAVLMSGATLLSHTGVGRAYIAGTSNDPNDLAATLIIILPFIYFMGKSVGGRGLKLLLIGAAISVLATILITQSRGGFLGLLAVSGAVLLYERVRPMKAVLLGCVILLSIVSFAPTNFWNRLSPIGASENNYNTTNYAGRIEIWKRGIRFMLANPVLGVGPDVFFVADGQSRNGAGKWSTAHNSFILVGAELGVSGLILFAAMIFKSLQAVIALRRKLPAGSPEAGLACAIEIGFYGYLTTGFFLSAAYSSLLVLLVGLSVAMTKIVTADHRFPVREVAVESADYLSGSVKSWR